MPSKLPFKMARLPGFPLVKPSPPPFVNQLLDNSRDISRPWWAWFRDIYAYLNSVAAIAFSGSAGDLTSGTLPAARMPALTGDVTTTAGTVVTTLSDGIVSDAKIRDSAALTVIGRAVNTTGSPADIAAGSDGDVLRRSGTSLGFGSIPQSSVTNLVADLAAAGLSALANTHIFVGNGSNVATDVAMSGDATLANTGALTIANQAVTAAKTANIPTGSILGRNTAGAGSYEVLTTLPATIQTNITALGTLANLTVTNPIVGSVTGTATTVITNADFTGPITSVGNTTSIASQTGSGTTFVMDTSPVLVTPTLGVATATSVNGLTPTAIAVGFTIAGGATPKTLTVPLDATVSGTNTGDQTTVSGNAGTATALQTARNINGVSFNGTGDITVTAAAGTLSGATLAAGVTASSLTSVGTLASLTVTATITGSVSGNAATATVLATPRAINGTNFNGSAAITVTAAAGTLTGTGLSSGVTSSSLTSVGTLTGLTVSGTLTVTNTGVNNIAGPLHIGSASSAARAFRIASITLSGDNQVGILCSPTFTTASVSTATTCLFQTALAAGLLATNTYSIRVDVPNINLAATSGTHYGCKLETQTNAAITLAYAFYSGMGLNVFGDTTDSTSITTGGSVFSGGVGIAKRLCLDGATGKTLRITNGVANGTVAVSLGSTGPTGSTAGAPQGWMRIDINGTDRYIPYW